jgi:hypothetical protein
MTTYTKEKNAVPKHVVRHDWFSINKDTAVLFCKDGFRIKVPWATYNICSE